MELSAQATLISYEPRSLPKSRTDYVPILQTRKGELDALAHLSAGTWSRTIPLVALSAHRRELPTPLAASTVSGWIKRLSEAVGQHSFYIDLVHPRATAKVSVGDQTVPALEVVYAAARKRNLDFMPVAPVTAGGPHLQLVAAAAAHDGRGLAVRYPFRSRTPRPGSSRAEDLGQLLGRLDQVPEDSDLVLDAEWIDPDVEVAPEDVCDVLESVSALNWRSVILAGTSIPATMGCVKEGSVGRISRLEWKLWQELSELGPARLPAFGDYGVQHPRRPSKGGPSMRRNIRYTSDDDVIVARAHGPFTATSNAQYRELCQQLTGLSSFSGEEFSWGDRTISLCAERKIPPRSQEMWRGAGTSHHLKFVNQQLARA
jgi:hypothetical protein